MSCIILHEKIKTARKTYGCAASEWITNGYSISEFIDDYKLPFSERRILAKAKAEKFKVLLIKHTYLFNLTVEPC